MTVLPKGQGALLLVKSECPTLFCDQSTHCLWWPDGSSRLRLPSCALEKAAGFSYLTGKMKGWETTQP